MVGGSAVGVLSADIGKAAHVHTLVPDTGPLAVAVRVADTLKRDAADLWVAICSWWTGAHRAMISWGANGISSTGSRDFTWVLTFSIVTSCSFGAVIVREALVR